MPSGVLWALLGALLLTPLLAAAQGGTSYSGFATEYGGKQDGGNPDVPVYGLIDGACGYGALARTEWPNWHVAALSFSNPVSLSSTPQKYGCGACIEVKCQGSACTGTGPVTVLVTDTCKDCSALQINMNALTFEASMSTKTGEIGATWRQVPCTPPGNIVVKVTSASGSYLRLVLMQVAGSSGVQGVDIRTAGASAWTPMAAAWGANWQTSSAGSPPFDVRLTPKDGSAPLVSLGAITQAAAGSYPTSVQLGGGAYSGNATALAPAPAPVLTAGGPAPNLAPQQIPESAPAVAAVNATVLGGSGRAAPPAPAPAAAPVLAPAAAAVPAAPPAAAVAPLVLPAAPPVVPHAVPPTVSAAPPPFPPTAPPVVPPAAPPVVPPAAPPVVLAAPPVAPAGAAPSAANPGLPFMYDGNPAPPATNVTAGVGAPATPPAQAPFTAAPTPAPWSGPVASFSLPASPPAATPVPAAPPVPASSTPSTGPAAPPVSRTASAPAQAPKAAPAAAPTPVAGSTPGASSPAATALSTGGPTTPNPIASASGNPSQPFSLNFNRAALNVTPGNSAAAPAVNEEVDRIVNPQVMYNG